MRTYLIVALVSLGACGPTAPPSVRSPQLDSGIRGGAAGGLGGAAVVGQPVGGAGVVNRIPVP